MTGVQTCALPIWLGRIWIAALLAALGALPAIVWNARHGWGSLASPIEDTTTYQHRLRIFASPLMPMMLGLRTPFTQEPLLSAAVAGLVLACLVGLFAYGAYRARRREASILYVVAACFPLLYALAPATLFSQEPKYLVVLSPVLVLLVQDEAAAAEVLRLHRQFAYEPGRFVSAETADLLQALGLGTTGVDVEQEDNIEHIGHRIPPYSRTCRFPTAN